MGGMLAELGKKLAERWLSLLVLPGALYLAVAATARALGHSHPFDLHRLTDQITEWANAPAAGSAGGQVVLLASVLGGAAAVGLVAQGLGSVAEQLHLAADWRTWPAGARSLARQATARRQTRWGQPPKPGAATGTEPPEPAPAARGSTPLHGTPPVRL